MNESTYFCGVDVSKDSFVASIKNGNLLMENRTYCMDKTGFAGFEQTIRNFKANIIIGMEPTGIYHLNLFNFLRQRNYNAAVVNPYMLHQFFKFTNNKPTKTDKKDSKTITKFLEFKQNEFIKNTNSIDEKFSVRYFVREKERITHDIAKTKTEIKRMLSLLFPEAEKLCGVFSQEFLSILLKFGSAAKIRKISKQTFFEQLKQSPYNQKGRKPNFSAEQIYHLACSSVAADWPDYEKLLKIKIRKLYNLIEEKQHISKLIQQKTEMFFKREIEILCSIPGISQQSAIYLLAEIVDIKRFNNYKKLVGFCGLDPIIKQSGKFKTTYRISKRGNAHARRII